MAKAGTQTRGSANPQARIVDLAAYRAARALEVEALPLFAQPLAPAPGRRVLSDAEVAHRRQMLQHLSRAGDRM